MAISIKSREPDDLARKLAATTGESITVAITIALRERLAREEHKRRNKHSLAAELMEIGRHCASLPVLDPRSSDEILGYDENGLPS
ncbi:MAG: type II toxin-antitoxin system VapB family antitoxin [Terracidiphilus sp.]|jgi:antitoxin VapB